MSGSLNYELYEYKGCNFITNIHMPEHLEKLEHFEIRDSDVLLVTFPKSGTVWMQHILILICCDGDLTAVENKKTMDLAPWIELTSSNFETHESPRLNVTHLPYHLVPKALKEKRGKIIYVARNPKDVLVSFYHFCNFLTFCETPKSFQDMLEKFLEGRVMFGSWFDHIQDWYAHRDEFNFFYITYEELVKDLRGSIKKICNFLGRPLDDTKLDTVVEQCTFNTMKTNPMANYESLPNKNQDGSFLRKGVIGDWKNHFTVAQVEMFDRIFQEKMKDFPLKFVWDNE